MSLDILGFWIWAVCVYVTDFLLTMKLVKCCVIFLAAELNFMSYSNETFNVLWVKGRVKKKKKILKGIKLQIVCSCLMCKSGISSPFGSMFLFFRATCVSVNALVVLTRPWLWFCYCKAQIRTSAVLSGSGGNICGINMDLFVLQFHTGASSVRLQYLHLILSCTACSVLYINWC